MGTYEQPGMHIDKSGQAANIAISKFNQRLRGFYDTLNKNYNDRQKEMTELREKNLQRYEKEFASQLGDIPDTEFDSLDSKINNLVRDVGSYYESSLVNQSLGPDDENYVSFRDAADARAKAVEVPKKIQAAMGVATAYVKDYNKAKLVTRGKPGSILEDGEQNPNHIRLLEDLSTTGGKYVTPEWDSRSGDLKWNYDDGQVKFSLSNAAFLRGGAEGESFFQKTGDLAGMVNPVVENLKGQVDYDKPMKVKTDTKYTTKTGLEYSGKNAQLNAAAERFEWNATLNSGRMKNVWGQLKDNALTDPNKEMFIGGEKYTGQEAFDYFQNKAWIGNGNQALQEDGTFSPEAMEQREFAKQMFVDYMNNPSNGFIKEDQQTAITYKYVAPTGTGTDDLKGGELVDIASGLMQTNGKWKKEDDIAKDVMNYLKQTKYVDDTLATTPEIMKSISNQLNKEYNFDWDKAKKDGFKEALKDVDEGDYEDVKDLVQQGRNLLKQGKNSIFMITDEGYKPLGAGIDFTNPNQETLKDLMRILNTLEGQGNISNTDLNKLVKLI